MANDWKSSLNFGEPTSVPHLVNGTVMQFYPVSVGMMFKLRTVAKPVAKALAAITSGGAKDTGNIFREVGDPIKDENGKVLKLRDAQGAERLVRDTETIAEAITPELAILRTQQRADSIEELIAAISDESNLLVIADIIMDSLKLTRDIRPPASEFIKETPLPMMTELIMGVAKANKGVFGPLTEKLNHLFTRAQGAIEARFNDQEGERQASPEQPQTKNGEPSQTA